MNIETKYGIIKRNIAEILIDEELKNLLENKENISAYYGTAPTGPVHLGYFIPLSKIFDFTTIGIKTKILIADIHAALDDLKSKWEELNIKTEYYKKCIQLAFPWKDEPKFIKGSEYQLEKDYLLDVLKLSTYTTVKRAARAASEVTRMKNPKVSELIYPIMQALDEEYLKVDIQVGGIDQRHIMAFAREYLPKLGYRKRIEIMTPLVASLQGPKTKMSASEPMTHIKVYDSEKNIRTKIKKAYCPEGIIKDNPIIQICQFIIIPIKKQIKIERDSKYGGDIEFKNFNELAQAYSKKEIHPLDLKEAVANQLIEIFKNVRRYFEQQKDMLESLGKEFL